MKSLINFESSSPELNAGFEWAKRQALEYAHEGDPVGDWYESALPGRNAFCMRDISHQSAGAEALGLSRHNKNMLAKFAGSIAESRRWCCFWEINGDNKPAPVDYTDDNNFWYNLPASFDVLDACLRAYKLTGDEDYLDAPVFTHFYSAATHNYVDYWDSDGDGLVNRRFYDSCLGIPSYNEGSELDGSEADYPVAAIDLIAAQIRGFLSYAELCSLRGRDGEAAEYHGKAASLWDTLDSRWYNAERRDWYGAMYKSGRMAPRISCCEFLPYWDVIRGKDRLADFLDTMYFKQELSGVEMLSYYPEIFFRHNQPSRGLEYLLKLTDPALERREYPEVSFAAMGCFAFYLCGVTADAASVTVTVDGLLPPSLDYAAVSDLPLFGGSVSYRRNNTIVRSLSPQNERSSGSLQFTNHTGAPLTLVYNGVRHKIADGECFKTE